MVHKFDRGFNWSGLLVKIKFNDLDWTFRNELRAKPIRSRILTIYTKFAVCWNLDSFRFLSSIQRDMLLMFWDSELEEERMRNTLD
jgi:hypothetical protein